MTKARGRSMRLGVGPRSPEDEAQSLPYQDLSELLKEAIEDALREAWKRLPSEARRQGIHWTEAGETTITRLLLDEMERLRTDIAKPIPHFSDEVFGYVTEGEGSPDATGKPFDENTKKPDLVIRPLKPPFGVARPRTYGMFVECKIIEHSKDDHGIEHYCKNGLRRFVKGEYACVMPSGMMVAYVRRKKTVTGHLKPYLAKRSDDYEVQSLPDLHPRRDSQVLPPVYVSTHGRSRVQIGTRGRSPGVIEIAHLWLDVA